MEDLDKLIEREKERIMEAFKEEAATTKVLFKEETHIAKKQIEVAVEDGLKRFTDFADTLKRAYAARIIGPEDLLRTIEKGGFIFHKIADTRDYKPEGEIPVYRFFEELVSRDEVLRRSNQQLKGRQKVTIIIEPLEG